MNIQEENILLKKQLCAAKKWMQAEVQQSQKNITIQDSQEAKNSLYHKNIEEIISEKIYSFFPSDVLMHFPVNGVENIISSELIYYHIIQGGHVDGIGVIIGYQKLLDAMIESYITKWFRKYITKNHLTHSPENSPLEKSFHSIVDKKYIFSLGRVFDSIQRIQTKDISGKYLSYFKKYLESRPFLQKSLLETDFLLQLKTLIHLHAITDKRHSWSLSPKDTTLARDACIWNFQNKNCLLYILAASQSVDY